MSELPGIDVDAVSSWLAANVPGVEPPLSFELVQGGRSNLTYAVADAAGRRYALRRPPVSHVLATAHDMSREYRLISALGPTPVPVPEALGFCDDATVTGAPFYVMRYVDGHVLRNALDAAAALAEPAERHAAGMHLVDVLADLHGLEPDIIGLGDFARRDGYIVRQLARWSEQFENSCGEGDVAGPLVREVHQSLADGVPEQMRSAIVHGDYRLDNVVMSGDGRVLAVLDWEICTLGDPLADVGLLMVYWAEAGDPNPLLGLAPTTLEGFPTRAELCARYAERSGADLRGLGYYVAFGYWKLACILQGVFNRYRAGAGAGDAAGFEGFGAQVLVLAEMAKDALSRLAYGGGEGGQEGVGSGGREGGEAGKTDGEGGGEGAGSGGREGGGVPGVPWGDGRSTRTR